MSFDVGSAAAASSAPLAAPQYGGLGPGLGVGVFEDEPPLLEELGINTKQIWHKTVSILLPFRRTANLHDDADLLGPFLLIMSFELFQLLAGKIHFGIILGWVTVAALFLYVVFNMLAGRNGNLDLYRSSLVCGVEDEVRLRSMMGIKDEVAASPAGSPSLHTYANGGSSPLRTISWTRFDSSTFAGRKETPAMSSGIFQDLAGRTTANLLISCSGLR